VKFWIELAGVLLGIVGGVALRMWQEDRSRRRDEEQLRRQLAKVNEAYRTAEEERWR
jgi:phosphoglycerate-specific signal transduction histidine kinase